MSFLEAGEVRLIADYFKNSDDDIRDYELEKESLWHCIKIAMICGMHSTVFCTEGRFKENFLNMLTGYGFKVTFEDNTLNIEWGAE